MEIITKESLLAKIKALQESLKNSQIARIQNSSLNGLQKKTTKVEDFDKKDSTKKNRKPKTIVVGENNKRFKSFDKIIDKAAEKAIAKSENAVPSEKKIAKNNFKVFEIKSTLAYDLWNKFGKSSNDDATKKNHFSCNNLSYTLVITRPIEINTTEGKKNLLCGYASIKSDGNKTRIMGVFGK